jgi:hypothetical protein
MSVHELFPSVAALLAPETLAELTGWPVREVRVTPLETQASAYSGSGISAIELIGTGQRLLLKRVSPAWDYFMRVTDDRRGRETLVWTTGLLDRLPRELAHPYLACARADDGAQAILLRDVGHALLSRSGRAVRTPADHDRILAGLAAFHAAFWEDATAARPADGFCEPRDHYHVISPAAARRDPEQDGVMPRIVRDGWERLADLLPAKLASRLLALTNDPTPLVAALAPLPQTIVHGDFRTANIGLEPGADGQALAIDWALVGQGVAGLDLVWYITGIGAGSSITRVEAIERYRTHLQRLLGCRFDDGWWTPMLELSLLGGLIRCGWIAARAVASPDAERGRQARADLAWWQTAAQSGMARLELP